MPTFFEKLTWSPCDGYGLRVAKTRFGNIGALICGENTNPLARYALIAQGEQVHISTWPVVWPTMIPLFQPDLDTRADYGNVAANRIRAAAHCFENKCFGILCTGHLDDINMKAISSLSADSEFMNYALKSTSRGAMMFLDPIGAMLPDHIIDPDSGEKVEKTLLLKQEGILYAEIDLDEGVEGNQYHDVVGGYQRLDVFDLRVDRTRRKLATFFRRSKTSDGNA
jgi:nitrilase